MLFREYSIFTVYVSACFFENTYRYLLILNIVPKAKSEFLLQLFFSAIDPFPYCFSTIGRFSHFTLLSCNIRLQTFLYISISNSPLLFPSPPLSAPSLSPFPCKSKRLLILLVVSGNGNKTSTGK